jgi:hypothetical protein
MLKEIFPKSEVTILQLSKIAADEVDKKTSADHSVNGLLVLRLDNKLITSKIYFAGFLLPRYCTMPSPYLKA